MKHKFPNGSRVEVVSDGSKGIVVAHATSDGCPLVEFSDEEPCSKLGHNGEKIDLDAPHPTSGRCLWVPDEDLRQIK